MADITSSSNRGYLEVFTGPMGCGKTRELITRIDRLNYMSDREYVLVKPMVDTRNSSVQTRFGNLSLDCILIDEKKPLGILNILKEPYHVVGIEEAQFFEKDIIIVIKELLSKKKHILVSGLDTDFRGEPFGYIPQIMALADEVHKLTSVCQYFEDGKKCGLPANRTQRLIEGKPAPYESPLVLIGDNKEGYEPRCLNHHKVPITKNNHI